MAAPKMQALEKGGANALGYLSGKDIRFTRSRGGLLAMTHKTPEGEVYYDRVIVFRCFPLTSPDDFLSVRDPNNEKREVGIIRHISELDEESERLLRDELNVRYYVPAISKVHSIQRHPRAMHMDVETDLGRRKFMMRYGLSAVRILEDGRVIFTDFDGNCYMIPDPKKLDKASYKKIEIYL